MGSSGFGADPTVRCGRHSEWRSVGGGICNDDAGSSCAQRTVEGHGTWCWSRVPTKIIVEFSTCTAQAVVFGGIKDRIARASTGMSKGVYMEGLCQVAPLQHSRLLRFQSCSFLCGRMPGHPRRALVAPHSIRRLRAPPPSHAYDPLLLLSAPARAS